jgi:zinc transport system ATP-binding protein
MALISCEHLTMKYDGRTAVNDVSFSLEAGDYLSIVGENGSGKSTLVKGMLGLMKPAAGTVRFSDLDKREIGYLPQQTAAQKDFPASVAEVVSSGCLARRGFPPFYTAADKQRVRENMERLEIGGLAKKCYRELSGGQQQRVLLARALCATRKLLLLDEPVAGLDPVITAELYALIDALNRERGITVIVVTHDVHSAVQCGNRILHMDTGAAFFGSREDYVATDICRRMMGVHTHAAGEGGACHAE